MSTKPQPAPVLAWHYDVARRINARLNTTHYVNLAEVIAAHDPHAETVRLLKELDSWVESTDGYEGESSCLRHQVRTHLAKLKGTQ